MLEKKKKFRLDHLGKIREIHKESIFDTLNRVVNKEKLFDFKENKADTTLNNRWLEIIGKDLGSLTSVKASKTGILTIEAKNSVIVQEINMMQNDIIQQFKSGSPIFVFKKITVKLKS
jgi:hypothetical protein